MFQLCNWANCFGKNFKYAVEKKVRSLLSKYSQSSSAKTRILFLSRQCDRLEESWNYLPDVNLLQKIQFTNCLPDCTQYTENFAILYFAQFQLYGVLVFQLPYHTLSRKCLTVLPYKLCTGTDISSPAIFLQLSSFTLSSIPARLR